MYTKTITYEDYNGEQQKEKFYFNLSKGELLEMELSSTGGYQTYLKRIINSRDNKELTSIFKDLILKSYGIKSDDGKRFIKTPELRSEFEQSAAYSELFVELATNSDSATAFVNGIIPPALFAEVQKDMATKGIKDTKELADKLLAED